VLWSATFALARSLSEQIGSLTAGAAAYLFGGVVCLVRIAWSPTPGGRWRNVSRRYLWGCGSLFVLYTALIYLAVGLAKTRAQLLEVALVNYLWPAATVLLSIPLLKKRASLLLVPGTLLALAGVFLVMTQGAQVSWSSFREHLRGNPAAYLLVLIAALAWALYSNLARRWSEPGAGGAVELFVPATGLVLLAMRLVLPERSAWSVQAVVEVGVLGTITALAYALWDMAMRKGNLLLVASCSYLTPFLSTLVSCAYLNVVPGSRIWVGCALIVVGSLVSWRSVSDAAPRQDATDVHRT
jgi:drug/metabolite transporter (DMT)-like permease